MNDQLNNITKPKNIIEIFNTFLKNSIEKVNCVQRQRSET